MKSKGRNKRKLFCFGDSIVPGWDAESTQRECSKVRRQADQVAIQQGMEEYEESMKLDPEEESLMDELDDQVNDWYEAQYWRDVDVDVDEAQYWRDVDVDVDEENSHFLESLDENRPDPDNQAIDYGSDGCEPYELWNEGGF